MEQQDSTDRREDDVDMITLPAESSAGLSSAQENGVPESSTASAGATVDGTSKPTSTADEQNLPIRTDVPPIAQQIKTIGALVKAFGEKIPDEGDVVYLVSRAWLNKAMALGADDPKSASKDAPDAPDGDLGPVDNSDIIQTVITDANGSQFVKLKPGMGMEEVELFPKDAWDLVMEWHGLVDGQYPIIRTAHNTNMDSYSLPNIQFEFHPPVLTIHRLWSAHSPIPIEQDFKQQNPPPPVVVHSSSYKYHDFLKKAKELVRVPLDRKVRLWKVIQTLPTDGTGAEHAGGLSTPPDSPGLRDETTGAWPHLLVEVSDFLKLQKEVERDLVDAPDTTCHAKYNGNRSLATVNLTVDTVLVIDESVDARDHVSTYRPSRSASKEKGPAVRGNSTSVTVKNTGSGRNSPAPGAVTRGRAGQHQRSGRTIGSVGLQNLGNTCYMNSALQCVRSVEELTKYFLTHEADKEINPDNPLSHNGEVAKAYGRLLDEIYRDPAPSSVAPRQFKSVIGRYAPAFSGYGQQDSQEFLGFLLDGLQEDLSRVKKKPYIPKPDSTDDMIGNPVAIREMADKVWDITKKRDDSVIADLFTGLYQSTLVCPVCDKVSITFDPFTNLTLPLPVASVWTNSRLRYFPLNDPPIELDVDLDKNSSIKTLKQFVSDRVGVPVERLFAAEVFRNKIFKLYEDLSTVNEEIHNNDVPAVFELEAVPTNVPFTKRERKQQKVRSLLDDSEPTPAVWEDPASERMLVPVVHRVFSENRHRKLAEADQIPAHVIVLTVEEARSEEVIRRKVLEKVATYSTWKGFHSDSDTSEENTDQELVNTSSDGDSNVVAKSVEGEDGLVDVKMGGGDSEAQAAHVSSAYPKLLKKFNSKRPTWIDAHEFLLPGLQNLFELSYFRGSTNIPCGWSEVTEDGQFPRLSSRLPKAPSDMEMTSPTDSWEGSEDSGDADAASLRSQPTAATRMVSESTGSDDEDIPAVKPVVTRSRPATRTVRAGKRSGPTKTYSRKDARKLAQASKPARQSQDSYYERSVESNEQEEGSVTGSGPLIRLGEGLVVDWSLDAYDALFAGTGPEDERGMPTWRSMEHVEDRSLVRSRKQREQQRKRGISLDDCLAEFEKEEILSEQDTWYCPRCKEHRRASKKFDLWKTPDILAVHLKRFSSAGYRREKLDLLVDFPVEGLDLTERVIDKGDGKKEIYDLIAVDDHWGGLGGGHYTAFAKNFIDGEWYEYNDTTVSKQKDVSRVVTKAAYLLFYRRRSDVPLGGPRFKEIFEAYDQQTNHSEESDSGEGQRLGQGSGSQRGSPSASTGAGRTALNGSRGLASAHSGGGGNFGNANDPTEYSPLYKSLDMDDTLDNADDDADPYQMSGMNQWQADDARPSIERDEGIEVDEWDFRQGRPSSGPLIQQGWNFSAINGGLARSEADNGSDVDSVTAQGDDGSSIVDDMVDEEAQYAKIDLGGPYPRHVSSMVDDDSAPPPYEEVGLSITADDITGVGDAEMDEIKDAPVTEIHLDEMDDVRDVKRGAGGQTKAY